MPASASSTFSSPLYAHHGLECEEGSGVVGQKLGQEGGARAPGGEEQNM